MARGALAAALTAALAGASGPIATLVEGFGSTARVRRATFSRDEGGRSVSSYADGATGRVAIIVSGLAEAKRVKVYGAESVAEREGVVREGLVEIDDVLVIESGPFAGEILRVADFGAEVPIAGVAVVALETFDGTLGDLGLA